MIRVLFIGDIVGSPGIDFVKHAVPILREVERLDFVVANAENASGGAGMTPSAYRQLRASGIDAVTMGDHIYKKADLIATMDAGEPICKPANFPASAPGKMYHVCSNLKGEQLAVISLMGRTYMRHVDCPFQAVDRVLADLPKTVRCILVDVHAEATADKYQLAHYLKNRVSAVLGTHTHVPTADEQILAGFTAFQCDVGMTGPYKSILGRRIDRVISTAISFVPCPFDVATEDVRLGGAIVEIEAETGRALSIRRVMFDEAWLNEFKKSRTT